MEVLVENTTDFEQKLEDVLHSAKSTPQRKGPPKTDSDSDDGLSAELGAMENLDFLPTSSNPNLDDDCNASRSSLGNVLSSSSSPAQRSSPPTITIDTELSTNNLANDESDDIDECSVEILDESSNYEDDDVSVSGSESSIVKRFENMHMQLTEVLRNDLKLDTSDRIPEEEWRRTSPLIFAGDEDPTGSSITASDVDGNFIGGWNDIERLDTSAGGESITIRLKIKNDDSFDLTDENDDSIELDPKAYEGLKDLLRRAEQSHKLSREVISKQSSPSPVSERSECSSVKSQTTVETMPVNKPKPTKLYEDDISSIQSAHAQELLDFLRGSSGVPPALSAASSSNSSVSGSPSRELRLEVVRSNNYNYNNNNTSHNNNSFPVSPSRTTSAVTVLEEGPPPHSERNPVVIVESKRARKERIRKAKLASKSVTIKEEELETNEKEKETKKKFTPKASQSKKKEMYENPYTVLERGNSSEAHGSAQQHTSSSSAFMPIGGSPKEKARTVNPSPIGVTSSNSKKKKARGRRGSKCVDEDIALLNSMRTTTFWQRNKAMVVVAATLTLIAVTLYFGGFHEVTVEDSSSLYSPSNKVCGGGRCVEKSAALSVDITSPTAGGVLKSDVAPLTWRMSGSAIVPGDEVQINIILDNVEIQSNKVTLPNDAVDFVDGSIDIQLDAGTMLRGTHNITVKCDSANDEAVGTSIFLYMKEAEEVKGGKKEGAKEAVSPPEVVPNQVKLELTQPTPGAVINGDTMVLKFMTRGFDMDVHSSLVKVVLIVDSGQEYTLEQNVQTISGLRNGSHKLQLFVILKETMKVLYADEVEWNHVEIATKRDNAQEVLVDGKGLGSINNAKLIELADASGISTSVRLKILNELEKRFEEFQRLYYE
ncbi:hypothetical protein TrLO_g14062 [Triparma laevis f. longispina]|uniref:Uncharacterized protein n=1 Tax=Triparma laevis f. longispina TaxID=1714387 RepID=A0A9W7FPA2_9STRA|nr:hypothetical protein TrLO_g14062 [Triparma laevis f. longispina]